MPQANKIEAGAENPLELRSGAPSAQRIEVNQPGGTFAQRAGASIPTTTEGKVSFLERIFGAGNVKTTPQGEILIPDPAGSGALVPFDERQVTFKDISADIVGPAIPVAATVAAGTNPLTVAGAAAAGETARIGAAELLTGGQTGQTRGEQAFDIGVSALLGGASQTLINLGAKVWDAIRPHNIIAKQVRKMGETPFARKGRRLEEKTGIPLTPGEETGSRSALMVEALARRTPGGADIFFDFHQARLRTSMTRIRETMDRIAPKGQGSFKVGTELTTAYDDALNSAFTIRSQQAKIDFGEVDRLSGGRKMFQVNNTANEIQRIVDEMDVPGAGDATQRIVTQFKKMRDSLLAPQVKDAAGNLTDARDVQRLSGEQLQRLLQVYTNAHRGTGSLLKDMPIAQSKMLAKRVKDALLRDMDEAVAASGEAGDIAKALTTARDRYRVNSEAINEIGDSVLSRLIGNRTRSPEAISGKFVKMHPSEVSEAMGIIERASPEAAQNIRRFFIETAVANAKPSMTDATAKGVKFSANKFIKSLPDLDTMKAAGFSRQEITEIAHVAKQLERIADRAFDGSPTAPLQITWDVARGLFAIGTLGAGEAIASGVKLLLPRHLAKVMATAEGRKALITLKETKPGTRSALQAITTLNAIIATEPAAQDVRPLGPYSDDNETTMTDVLGAQQQ